MSFIFSRAFFIEILGATTFITTTSSIMTLNMKRVDYSFCRLSSLLSQIVMLNAVMLVAVTLVVVIVADVILAVVILAVVMLSVMAPN